MDVRKINEIIADKNDRLEREAVRSADHIIGTIVQKQAIIANLMKEIEELRVELKGLEVEHIDPTQVLG